MPDVSKCRWFTRKEPRGRSWNGKITLSFWRVNYWRSLGSTNDWGKVRIQRFLMDHRPSVSWEVNNDFVYIERRFHPGLSSLGTLDALGYIILCGEAVAHTVGCLEVSLVLLIRSQQYLPSSKHLKESSKYEGKTAPKKELLPKSLSRSDLFQLFRVWFSYRKTIKVTLKGFWQPSRTGYCGT